MRPRSTTGSHDDTWVLLADGPSNNGPDGSGLRRQAWLDECELVVAEVSGASAEVGAEVMYALHKRRVPTLCLVERGHAGTGLLANPHPPLTTVESSVENAG